MPDELAPSRPPFGDDDELLARLGDVIGPEPAQPTHAEMASMFQALDDMRAVAAPAAVAGVRRGLRWVVLAGAAAAVVLVIGLAIEAPRRPARLASAPTTTTISPDIDAAGRALVSLERALAGTDPAGPSLATAAADARAALARLTPEERAAFEPRASTLLAEADARTGTTPPPDQATTPTVPDAVETTTTTVDRSTTTTVKPPRTTTTTTAPTTTTTAHDDHGDHSSTDAVSSSDSGSTSGSTSGAHDS